MEFCVHSHFFCTTSICISRAAVRAITAAPLGTAAEAAAGSNIWTLKEVILWLAYAAQAANIAYIYKAYLFIYFNA